MTKLFFIILICTFISTGYLQEYSNYNNYRAIGENLPPKWPFQVYHEEPQKQAVYRTEPQLQKKPCPNRRNNVESVGPRFQSFILKDTKPPNQDFFQPQSLKNVIIIDEDKSQEPVTVTPELILDNGHNNPEQNYENNDSQTNKQIFLLNEPQRRFLGEQNNSDIGSLEEDYDCDVDLDEGNDYELRSEKTQTLPGITSSEQKVIELLKDCLNKKQKQIAGRNSLEEIPLPGSRRSMGGSDTENVNDELSKINDEEQQTTTNTIGQATNDYGRTEDNYIKAGPATLRPGKLFDELQHPAKGTVINDPVPKRMTAENSRVCYACSTATNPSCWEPYNRTTIKYCRKDQQCVTKSFGVKNSLTLIRDCALSCDESAVHGVEPKYNDCQICYSDLCNSASISSYSLVILILATAIKCTF